MTYKITATGTVQRIADGAFIPADEDNADWVAYLAWVAEGNTAQPDVPDLAALANQVKNEARALRTVLFARFDGMQGSAATRAVAAIAAGDGQGVAAEVAIANEIEGVKIAMRAITTDVDLSSCETLPQMRRAFKTRWDEIRAPLSPGLKSAFVSLDA